MIRRAIVLAVCAAAIVPAAAQRRASITPYLEVSQVATAELNGGETLTYSQLGAGVDGSIRTRRMQVQLSYQYQHRVTEKGSLQSGDSHNGLAQARIAAARGLTLEAGAVATRTRTDARGDALTGNVATARNLSQLYSGYAGPKLDTGMGPLFVQGAYRFGFTKVDDGAASGVPAALPRVDRFDHSTSHAVNASIGTKPGAVLPIGLSLSGGLVRERASQLDQRFASSSGRGDAIAPVTRTIALVGGVGYETISVRQRDPLLDASGRPVVDGAGRFATDAASPLRLAYDFGGLFWDGGVSWRPSRRTALEVRIGRRYGAMRYTGSFTYQRNSGSGIQVAVYDTVETYGQQVGGSLAALPVGFVTTGDPFGAQAGACIYGTSGAAAGGCIAGAFSSAATAAYRGRGVTANTVWSRGTTRFGLGGGFARRDFLTPVAANVGGGSWDESFYAQAFAALAAGRDGTIGVDLLASYYDGDIPGSIAVLGWGANTAYTRRLGQLSLTATAGVYGSLRDGPDQASAQALIGARYGF
ncbi:hypothetical protein [Sphingomonas sp. TDK1]|uniref:hypothetical protein n=1 Tax=Sphingomonas sp. TDK1 TaxID=453247 RepID=UPI0007D9FA38|nr:hypothetical protein [Sphingomonas sp. TDK1]OAN64041.1 hypothetical protein A7X12_18130 [Sphingomonas sp. TDK1]